MASFTDSMFKTIDNILWGINNLFAQPVGHYCRLETSVDSNILVADDGSMISVIELIGSLQMIGVEEHQDMIKRLYINLASVFKKEGHAMQISMMYTPEGINNQIHNNFKPSRNTALNLGIDINCILDDWEDSIAQYCAIEKIFIVLWTRPFILPPTVQKKARKDMGQNVMKAPYGNNCQTIGKLMTKIKEEHTSFVSLVKSALQEVSLITNILDCHTALWWVRFNVDPTFTSLKWRALLPGDRISMKLPDIGGNNKSDLGDLFYPSLRKQIFPREGINLNKKSIQIGDYAHASLLMNAGPQTPRPFTLLFKALKSKKFAWRASFLFNGDGLSSTWFKHILSSILFFSSSSNKMLNAALDELKELQLEGKTIIKFQACFDTWVKIDEQQHYQDILNSHLAEMAGAIQSWGSCDVMESIGDPLLTFSSTIPCLMPTSPAPAFAAPLQDPLFMMPLTRPASPWTTGSILLRTPDGKPMPFAQGTSLQSAWIDVGFAPMGGGKSVWLNTINWGFLTQAGLARLPWLSIIDVGPSSSGLISLLQSILPEDQKYLAVYYRLKMTKEDSINPFDLPLGCTKPFVSHNNFLVNFLSLLATSIKDNRPENGIPAIAQAAVTLAYDEFSPERNPKKYVKGSDQICDQLIFDLGIEITSTTTWWEIVDFFYDAEKFHEAILAQRYAVPTLPEVGGMARRRSIADMYQLTTSTGEKLTDYFWRSCIDAGAAYPIINNITRLDLGDAKIISLDLDEVAPRGGEVADRQTGVMYMLARQIVGAKFFLMPSDLDRVPSKFKAYHAERIKNLRQDPKRLCYDELHRVARNSSVAGQLIGDLETSARESRKWNLHIGLYSQSMDDFPEIILELATSIFILGAGTKGSIQKMTKKLGINKTTEYAILNLRKPSKKGANMVAFFKTSKGTAIHLLTNTIGMRALWAFSSTTEDVQVRNTLYFKIGVTKTLEILAKKFPGGIKEEIERRKQNVMENTMYDDNNNDVIENLIQELLEER